MPRHPIVEFTDEFLSFIEAHPFVSPADWRRLANELGGFPRLLVEAEARARGVGILSELARDQLLASVGVLLQQAEETPELAQVACILGASVTRAVVRSGYLFDMDIWQRRACDKLGVLAGRSEKHRISVGLSRFLFLEGVYDARSLLMDSRAGVAELARRRSITTMREFFRDQLEPAREERDQLLKQLGLGEAERARMTLAQRHRSLTIESAREKEYGNGSMDSPNGWVQFASDYDQAGNHVDATGALVNAVDAYLAVLEHCPEQAPALKKPLHDLCSNVELRQSYCPTRELHLHLLKSLVQGFEWVTERAKAVQCLQAALSQISSALVEAGDDVFARSYILKDSDDWAGLALTCAATTNEEFLAVWRGLGRRLTWTRGGVVQNLIPVLGRQHAHLALVGETDELFQVEPAYRIARLIESLHNIADDDKNSQSHPTSGDEWMDTLARVNGNLRLRDVAKRLHNKDIEVHLVGNAVHVPWAGLLLHAQVGVRSILQILPVDALPLSPGESDKKGIYALNAFSCGEQWHVAIASMVAELKGKNLDVTSIDSIPKLPDDAGVILLGCHGRRDAFGDLQLQVGKTFVPPTELLKAIPPGCVVFCGVCYAGGGWLSALGDWESLPGILIKDGARMVLANCWPAWDIEDKRKAVAELISTVAANSHQPTIAARAFFTWQAGQRGEHPRWWSGWGLWAGRATMS